MLRLTTLLVIILSLALPSEGQARARQGRPARAGIEAALARADKTYDALKKDARRRRFRDQWESAARRYEAVARKYPRNTGAAEALFKAADAWEGLSNVSRVKRDVQKAVAAYEEVCRRYPRSRAADDARAALAKLEPGREDAPALAPTAVARSEARTESASDQTPARQGASRRDAADLALARADRAYAALKKDSKRRKYRDQWEAVAARYDAVADRFPSSPRAAEALYKSADLWEELSRVSLAKKDLKKAVASYELVCKRFPENRLADDAHVALGNIYRDRMGDTALATSEFKAAASRKGDMQRNARAALTALARVEAQDQAVAAQQAAEPVAPPAPAAPDAQALMAVASAASDAANPVAAAVPTGSGPPAGSPAPVVRVDEADEADEEDEEEELAAAPESSPARSGDLDASKLRVLEQAARADVPLSVQVGLKVRRVIIDPGHGGHDTGAIGLRGTREKDITLAIARKVKARLEEQGYEALMTRESDRFVSLEGRARFANRRKGDLFVSIHCNAHRNRKLRGTETFTLNVTADRYAIRLAARENASSVRRLSDLQFVLADLATRANASESTKLARGIQSELLNAQSNLRRRPRNLGVKQALFYVLLGTRMPSVLVETAFLSNPEDEKRLGDPAWQSSYAEAIASGVQRFTAEREALAEALLWEE